MWQWRFCHVAVYAVLDICNEIFGQHAGPTSTAHVGRLHVLRDQLSTASNSSVALLQVQLLYMQEAGAGWLGLNDHSKWAVSMMPGSLERKYGSRAGSGNKINSTADGVVCLGDLNREVTQVGRNSSAAETLCCPELLIRLTTLRVDRTAHAVQMYRGGGTICFDDNAVLWHMFSALIVASSRCKLSNATYS